MIHPSAKLYKDVVVDTSCIGANVIIGECSRIKNSEVKDYCSIDRQNLLMGVKMGQRSYTGSWDMIFNCKIGSFCSISYGVTIGAPEHDYTRVSTHQFIYEPKFGLFEEDLLIRKEKFALPLIIGSDVWIGCNSTILRGVQIGCGAVVAANAVVVKDVPPYAIVAGVPARIIKYRFSQELIDRLIELQWWNWNDEKIKDNKELFLKKHLEVSDLKVFE